MILKILTYPDPRLKQKSLPVVAFDNELQNFIDELFATLYSDRNNAGLAAVQVGQHLRITVMDTSENRDQPLCLINPEILTSSGTFRGQEGCLSFPGAYEEIERAEKVTFKALDRYGVEFTMDADGLLAECVQHEIDHMDGILFIDRLSPMRRQRALARMKKYKSK